MKIDSHPLVKQVEKGYNLTFASPLHVYTL